MDDKTRPAEPVCRDEDLFNNLMDNLSDAVYFKDLQSRFIAVNKGLTQYFGLASPQDAIGKTDRDFFTREHAEQALRDERNIIETGQPIINIEEKETWRDGHESWVSTSKLPLLDSFGNIIGTFGISRDITERKRIEQKLQRSEEELRDYVQSLQADLERASQIQRSLLPAGPPVHSRLDVQYVNKPLETVGGDYFAFFPQAGNQLGLFIGDLTGHGVSAALFMALIKFLSDRAAQDSPDDPKRYLEWLNAELMNQMPSAFITAIYACFEPREGDVRLVMADAGHPEPILMRRSGEAELVKMRGNAAIGILESFLTAVTEVFLEPGDRVFFYTDGIPETRNSAGEMLGVENLVHIIHHSAHPELNDTLDAILRSVKQFRGDEENIDDTLLIGVEAM